MMNAVSARLFPRLCRGGVFWVCVFLLLETCVAAAPGKLLILGGGTPAEGDELWRVMLENRLGGRPIGIISTASAQPDAVGGPLAEKLNQRHGAGSAVFVPVGGTNGGAEDAAVVDLVRGCGAFYFTGGQQDRTARAFFRPDGGMTAVLSVIHELHRQGAMIGGNSAGAAIMSDPMILGGTSADALLHGVAQAEAAEGKHGVRVGRGLGFHPGVLYCQHHLERGRFGRLLTALTGGRTKFGAGVGIAEDTAWLVDLERQTGTVLGAKAVLYLDARAMERHEDGGISGVSLHYLGAGDSIHFGTGKITPAAGKESWKPAPNGKLAVETDDAWGRDALRNLLLEYAETGVPLAYARDPHHELRFSRSGDTQCWRRPGAANGQPGAWTLTHLQVAVVPMKPNDFNGRPGIPDGKASFTLASRDRELEVFTYRQPGWRDGPLFVVLHGMNRNADDYRDNGIALARACRALIAVPAFDKAQFPSEAYQRGGITREGAAVPEEEWTFQHIGTVVEEMRARAGRADMPYYLIGHSAGGQFLNRLSAFLPGQAQGIVASNPGTLIFPTRDMPFPLGFGGLPGALGSDERLKSYLGAPLTLFLGTADTGLENLDQSANAMRQGGTRIERGRACFAMGKALAEERGWPFGWRLVEAEGVGHDSKAMFAHPAVMEAVFGPNHAATGGVE